ncbi:hypothetical protein V2J09_009017 [Rumex salicifolius]
MPSLTPHDILAVNRSGHNGNRQGSAPSQGGGASGLDKETILAMEDLQECQEIGHVKEGCFKLIGYPDWWKGLRSQGQRPSSSDKLMANVQDVGIFGNPMEQMM